MNKSKKNRNNDQPANELDYDAVVQQNEALLKLNAYSLGLSKLTSEDNLEAFIAMQAKEITGATAAIFSKYSAEKRTTSIQHIAMEPGLLEKAVALLDKKISQMHSVISDETYREMTSELFGFRKTLHEASFGEISRPVGAAIEILLNLDHFIGISYILDGKLFGTTLLCMGKGQADPQKNILESFISLSTISLWRKRAEDALRASETLHSKMISNIGDVIVIIDQNGINRYKSPNIEKHFGWKPEDLVGCSAFDNVHPEDLQRAQAFIGALALTPNASGTTEVRYHCKDGSYQWIEITIVNLLHDASINGFLGNYQDITGRKQAEEALRESEEKYRLHFLNMNSYNSLYEVVTDKEGKPYDFRFILVNHAYEKYVGKTAHELVGKTLLEVYPATEQYWIDKMAEVALTGVPSQFENFSQVMNTHTEINLYVPQKGQLAMTTGNIDDRKKAESALREMVKQLAKAQEIAHIGSWELDVSTGHLTWSDETYRIFGFEPRECEATYESFLNAAHPEDRARVDAAYNTSLKDRLDSYQIEHRIVRQRTGEIRFVEEKCEHVRDASGNIIRSLGMVQDITQRKMVEAALQNTQKLESLGLLAGGIAHDFNNLMGGIFGYIDMAKDTTKETKVTSYLSKAMNTIDRARALTLQLLTFAEGGAPIKKIDNLFPFVEETAKFALSGANVSCNFDIMQNLWACNFDKNQIGQVIDNLIINAQQAMPLGGTIELSAQNIALAEKEHPLLVSGKYVRISVVDSGIGIPKELIAKIFDPFFTTKAKGHGLGLATCYSIINRHGGCIDVESEPGKGCTFKVYLPASTEVASSESRNTAEKHTGCGTFLIMDDEEAIRETVGDMLESFGYTVISKENGKDAIDFIMTETKANRTIAAMIFDLTVPGGMGGKEAIAEIRRTSTNIPPAFVASGYGDDPVMTKPAEYGFTASICKPFMKSDLSEMLNKYIQTKK